jgi:hypothetical protein
MTFETIEIIRPQERALGERSSKTVSTGSIDSSVLPSAGIIRMMHHGKGIDPLGLSYLHITERSRESSNASDGWQPYRCGPLRTPECGSLEGKVTKARISKNAVKGVRLWN